MAQIEVRNVYKIFGNDPQSVLPRAQAGDDKADILAQTGHTVGLSDVNLSIEKGEIFVIMGLSGSGKSTLIRHFNRLIDPTAGHILFDGADITEMPIGQLIDFRRHHMSMVFQRFGLMPHRKVIDNVAFGLEVQGMARAARHESAAQWIDAVGLQGYEQSYPAELSGGMQQRVGLARALCTDPEVLLMDEAFSALDPLIRSDMQDQLVALQSRLGKTIVFITHDLDEALRIGDRIAILKDGSLSQVGAPADILLRPADDYVRAFVKDVNRARALSIDVIMRPPALRLTDETIEEALQRMRKAGEDYCYVVDDNTYRGVIAIGELEQVPANRSQGKIADLAKDGFVLPPDVAIEDAVVPALQNNYPLPVVDDQGQLRGVVDREDMATILESTGSDPDAENGERSTAA